MQFDRYGKTEFFASCAKGLSGVLADEARGLGLSSVRPLASGVSFRATMEQACRALLWMRTASRLTMVVERVPADDSDALYEGCRAIDWSEHVPEGATIAVHAKGTNDRMRSTMYTQMRVKDAICDSLLDSCGWRPDVDARDPDLAISVNLHKSKATISIDLSGKPMHMRGYRNEKSQVKAPIRETLAAAVLLSAGWEQIAADGGGFVDPFCGGGTLAIEAAMIAGDVAPGISRQKWGVQGWKQFDEGMLDQLLDEADDRAEEGLGKIPPIFASDIDSAAVGIARGNVKRAGLAGKVNVKTSDVADLRIDGLPETGLVAANPPYGDRLMSESQLPSLLGAMADFCDSCGGGWKRAIIVPDPSADFYMGGKPETTIDTFNGPIEASIRVYPPRDVSEPNPLGQELEGQAQEFANRLRKMARHRGKWARRNGITCYRVYDSDLPDFAISVDIYNGAASDSGRRWAYVCEYAAPKTVDPELATARLAVAVGIVREQFGLGAADVFVKRRARSQGGSQYAPKGQDAEGRGSGQGGMHYIAEGGNAFLVNFEQRLDTGIFLDGRPIRKMIQGMSAGKRFLNLFAYTGTASVAAAAGGASSTHTVDMSQTYLDWAKRNMQINGFTGTRHTFERAEAVSWVTETRHSPRRFDLVYVDPPTFSNSKKMGSRSWDVQRDHAELLIGVSRILSKEGVAIFCCNLRNFKPDTATLSKAGVELEDISSRTIPEDFSRNSKIHHCYLVRRPSRP